MIDKIPKSVERAIDTYRDTACLRVPEPEDRAELNTAILQFSNSVREEALRECIEITAHTGAFETQRKIQALLPTPKPDPLKSALEKLRASVPKSVGCAAVYFNLYEHAALLKELEGFSHPANVQTWASSSAAGIEPAAQPVPGVEPELKRVSAVLPGYTLYTDGTYTENDKKDSLRGRIAEILDMDVLNLKHAYDTQVADANWRESLPPAFMRCALIRKEIE